MLAWLIMTEIRSPTRSRTRERILRAAAELFRGLLSADAAPYALAELTIATIQGGTRWRTCVASRSHAT